MGADPVVNWLSSSVRTLLRRVEELENAVKCSSAHRSTDSVRAAPVSISIFDCLQICAPSSSFEWNAKASEFHPRLQSFGLASNTGVEVDWDSCEFVIHESDTYDDATSNATDVPIKQSPMELCLWRPAVNNVFAEHTLLDELKTEAAILLQRFLRNKLENCRASNINTNRPGTKELNI